MAVAPDSILHWTFPLPRLFGRVRMRAHWTILLLLAFDLWGAVVGRFLGGGFLGLPYLPAWPWWLIPTLPLLLGLTYYVHEAGHALAARWVGGRLHACQLQMFIGGVNEFEVPTRPGALTVYALGGMVANGAVAAICWGFANWLSATGHALVTEALWFVCTYLVLTNLRQIGFNLFCIFPCDLSLLVRAALWRPIALRRAVATAIVLGYLQSGLVLAFGIIWQALGALCLGIMMLMSIAREHQMVRAGHDPWMHFDPANLSRDATWWSRWQRARTERRRRRIEADEDAEQAILDALLAKVSQQGLPALTKAERATLERISKRQRERQLS